MKSTNLSIFAILTTIFLGAISFPGLVYLMRGNWLFAVVAILIYVALLGGVMYLLIWLKTKGRNDGFGFKEIALLLLFLILSAGSFIPIFHFFNLEFEVKTVLQNKGRGLVEEFTKLEDRFNSEKETALTNLRMEMFNRGASEDEIEGAQDAVAAGLDKAMNDNKSTLGSVEEDGIVIETWDRRRLYQAFYNLQLRFEEHLKNLENAFKSSSTLKEYDLNKFGYEQQVKVDKNVISDPRILWRDYEVSYIVPLSIWLFFFVLILLPYFLANRGELRGKYVHH